MRYKTKMILSYLMTLTLVLGCLSVSNTAKAEWNPPEEEYDYSKENATIWKTYSGSVGGVERTLVAVILEDGTTSEYMKVGEEESDLLWYENLDVGIDQYGAVWVLTHYNCILWWSYDLKKTFDSPFTTVGFFGIPKPGVTDFSDSYDEVDDVESLIFEGSGEQAIVTGYKTFSGEIHPLPSFDEMKAFRCIEDDIPEPLYIPKGMESLITPRPATPTPVPATPTPDVTVPSTPTQTPDASGSSTSKPLPTTSATVKPSTPAPDVPASSTPSLTPDMSVIETPAPASDTPTPKVSSKKLSIKTEKNAKVLYDGDEFIGQYTLKKDVLNWKGPKKKGKIKAVKQAGFNKKTKNLVILTKKGDGYILSLKNGKKKRVVKKKGKKLIYSGKFVTKIKTTSGKVDVGKK